MRLLTLFTVFLLVTATATAEAADEDKSPAERAIAGDKTSGVFLLSDAAHCSAAAAKRVIKVPLIPADKAIGKTGDGKPLTAAAQSGLMRDIMQGVMDQLVANGDPAAARRHVCVGVADYGAKGPNASSLGHGYVISDPRLMDLINSNPNRTAFSVDMFWIHELAHQIQYWHRSPFLEDKIDRRTELAADCTASGLIVMKWTDPAVIKSARDGVVAASSSVGDYNFESTSHHGTAPERRTASWAGVDIVLNARAANQPPLTSKALLDACSDYIVARDKKWGTNWPPNFSGRD